MNPMRRQRRHPESICPDHAQLVGQILHIARPLFDEPRFDKEMVASHIEQKIGAQLVVFVELVQGVTQGGDKIVTVEYFTESPNKKMGQNSEIGIGVVGPAVSFDQGGVVGFVPAVEIRSTETNIFQNIPTQVTGC